MMYVCEWSKGKLFTDLLFCFFILVVPLLSMLLKMILARPLMNCPRPLVMLVTDGLVVSLVVSIVNLLLMMMMMMNGADFEPARQNNSPLGYIFFSNSSFYFFVVAK